MRYCNPNPSEYPEILKFRFNTPLKLISRINAAFFFIIAAFTDEEQQGLDTHNKFRATHGVPRMNLDREMCDQAKAYASILAQTGIMKHSSNAERPGQGENLSMGCSTNKAQPVEEAVTNW